LIYRIFFEILEVQGINGNSLECKKYSINQSSFFEFPEAMFRLIPKNILKITKKIEDKSICLKKICVVSWGARGIPTKDFHLDSKINDKCFRMVKGKDISRYLIQYSNKWFLYDEPKLYRPSLRDFFENEKILISEVTGESGLVAAYDKDKYYTDHSLNCCILMFNLEKIDNTILRKRKIFVNKEGIDLSKNYSLHFILSLFNSKLLNFYFKKVLGYKLNVYPESLEMFPVFNLSYNDKNQQNIVTSLNKLSSNITFIKSLYTSIMDKFEKSISNQPIKDQKSCKFGHYFDNYGLYGMERETSGRINEIKAKILSLDVKEEGDRLVICMTNFNEEQNQLWEDIKAVKLTIKDEDVRKFLFFALKRYINGKGGRGFGSGNLLELIKNIEVPVYVQNVNMNISKIKEVMKEFNHLTKDLWFKDENKKEKFKSLNELESELKKTDKQIDEMVYKLYGITEEEKKIIEENLK